MNESRIELTHRLIAEGRWDESKAWKLSEIKRLRAGGKKAREARAATWETLAAKYPPLEFSDKDAANGLSCDEESLSEEEDEDAAFLASMQGLPTTADATVEIDWIAAHPAIIRLDQGGSHPVRLTPSDVKAAPHGPAPSRRAVVSLQHWSNDPSGLHRVLADEFLANRSDRRTTATGSSKVVDDLTEITRLLSQYERD